MAFWDEGNIGGGWQGLMGKKRKIPRTWRNPGRTLPNTGPPGLVPRRMPTAPYQGMEPTATLNSAAMPKKKGFFGKMSPEELKDFQEVLKEMRLDIKPEFVGDLYRGEDKQYAHQPFLFDEATAAEYQRRRKLNPYI